MNQKNTLSTDYLIVGAGAMGLAFADTLFTENPKASLIIVDKRAKPGGHWVDAYPFVSLHQPAAAYGVNSTKLGKGGSDLSSRAEILFYFETVLEKLKASGRVRFLPMCICEEFANDEVNVRSLVDLDTNYQITINKRLVDATYMKVQVPATHPPKYSVSSGHTLIPPNGLSRLDKSWGQYTVIGAGKTGIDAILFLLDMGVVADKIQWIISNDMWLWNRDNVQTYNVAKELTAHVKAIKSAESLDDIFLGLEKQGSFFRLDTNSMPSKWRCATVSPEEFEQLKKLRNIVRLGRVKEITEEEIILDQGRIPGSLDHLYVDCSANGLEHRPPVQIFNGKRITLQSVFMCQQVFSAAIIAKLEALNINDEKRNGMWEVIPHPEKVEEFSGSVVKSIENVINGNKHFALWLMKCRLNIISHVSLPKYALSSFKVIVAINGADKAVVRLNA